MEKIKVALDWTPNIMHAGFYVAQVEGIYQKNGLEVCLLPPSKEHSPPRLLEMGEVQFAIMCPDDIVFYHTQENRPRIKGIASLVQHKDDLSALCVWTDKIKTLADIHPDHIYARYGGHYEMDFVQFLCKNAGGKGFSKSIRPEGTDSWKHFTERGADATWIYTPVEGVECELSDKAGKRLGETRFYYPYEYGIPYYNSPILATTQNYENTNRTTVQKFVQATQLGYEKAETMDPNDLATLMINNAGLEEKQRQILVEGFKKVKNLFKNTTTNRWGTMDNKCWENLINWMGKHNMLKDEHGKEVSPGKIGPSLFSNEALK